ncbi:SrfA family protein [Pseudomonas cerasi]
MRNAIQGPLLRTGHNSSFKALGETGYPVFKMAFQLREAIYRLDAGRDLARHLAVPQNDQGGDRTDWYSSFPGDIIPWSSASETERASARQQFSVFHIAVQALSEQLLNVENSGAGGDRRVFAQLLKSVSHFPDYDFVYLVNGVMVITFWGFVHPGGEQRSPLHWLEPASVPAPEANMARAVPPPVTSASIPVNETLTAERRWYWRWRWLLLLLLGLLFIGLLLGLLRGCTPSLSLPGLPGFSGSKLPALSASNESHLQVPDVKLPELPAMPDLTLPKIVGQSGAAISVPEGGLPSTDQDIGGVPSATKDPHAASNTPPSVDIAPTPEAATPAGGVQPAPGVVPTTEAPVAEPGGDVPASAVAPNTVAPVIPAVGKPLTIPPTQPDGPAQFLNGRWRVDGGIQDKLTGRPLQLQYNFKQGNGTVSVRQSSGVTCQGPARGDVQQGALNITNPEQMKCSDGSDFIAPVIACNSPAADHAECVGSNDGEKTFPIRMLQPNT